MTQSAPSGRCILVLGGARSGKSRYAHDLAVNSGKDVLFVATGEPLDDEMKVRIEKHRSERPESWRTLEAPVNLAARLSEERLDAGIVLIDCLTLLVSNVILRADEGDPASAEPDGQDAQQRVASEIAALIEFMRDTKATFIVVSNEVGLGLVPENRLGRMYRDVLGQANQSIAEHADEVCYMVAGIPQRIKGEGIT